MKLITHSLQMLLIAIVIYFCLYFIFMSRAAPSIDKKGYLEFACTPRFTKFERKRGGFGEIAGHSTVANYIFYPADYIYWHIWNPKRWQEIQRFVQKGKLEEAQNERDGKP